MRFGTKAQARWPLLAPRAGAARCGQRRAAGTGGAFIIKQSEHGSEARPALNTSNPCTSQLVMRRLLPRSSSGSSSSSSSRSSTRSRSSRSRSRSSRSSRSSSGSRRRSGRRRLRSRRFGHTLPPGLPPGLRRAARLGAAEAEVGGARVLGILVRVRVGVRVRVRVRVRVSSEFW